MTRIFLLLSLFACSFAVLLRGGEKNVSPPGHFRKIVLDQDQELDGKKTDTLREPMELSVAGPMDLELGPDGCLYLIEWGTAWANNLDTQIVRIEYIPETKNGVASE